MNAYFQGMPQIDFLNGGVNITAPIAIGFMVPGAGGASVNAFTLLATTYLSATLSVGASCRLS